MANLSQFNEAAAAVKHSPHAVSAWEQVEAMAADLDRPDDVVALYNDTLIGNVEPQVAEMIGERAGGFCDEWFGDEPAVLEGILVRVTRLAPASDSALQRLSVLYTVAERWTDALSLYDRAVDATADKPRRVRLLREAAQLAKDVANQPDNAIRYYQALLPLAPDDGQIRQSLERLLERHERWSDLIALWESRLESQSRKERERTRARIAAVWLDHLRDPQRALAAAKPLLAEADDDREPCALLERVLESPQATKGVRDATLDLLRSHHDTAQRPREVVRVLERAIALDPATCGPLREEAGGRLADLDDLPPAMDHYAALLAMAPQSSSTQEKLRALAERGKLHDRYADGVAAAARSEVRVDPTRRVELLGDAARTRLERLDDIEAAIALLVEAGENTAAAEQAQFAVAKRLAALYDRTNRPRERLGVLERQAQLEPNDAARSAILTEAAKLAESLGDTERALTLWGQRIDSDPSDLAGLDARISILESQERWDELVASLETRAEKVGAPNQKRADLVRVALVHHHKRRDLASAIRAWDRVVADHKDDEEGISALADLLAETERWSELANLLESASGRATHRTVSRLVRLGDALRAHLSEEARALRAYRSAIAIEPTSREARAGLTALLEVPATRAGAADALSQTLRITGDLAGVLDLLPTRLGDAKDDRTRLALLREAAQLRLEYTHDAPGALSDLARAFPLAPRDQLIENQVMSLAKATGNYDAAATAYAQAIDALGDEPREAARLRLAYADLLVDHLGQRTVATDAYAQVASVEPGNRRAVHAFASFGAQLERWDDAASIVVRHCAVREAFDDELLSILELAAGATGQYDALAGSLSSALERQKLPAGAGAAFFHRLALIHRDHRDDRQAAVRALRRAIELGGERAPWLADLVALERDKGPSAPLLDALRRLADADARDLDSLVGAADVASKLGERDQALAILSAVLGRATAAWRGTASIRSSRSVDAVAKWAIDGLVDLYRTGGRARAAVDTLIEAARLPFDQNTRRDMRLRAAQLATAELGDHAAAIDMYRSVLAQSPNDPDVIEKLAHLLALEDRVPELLTLRQIQLGLERGNPASDAGADRKLALRLEMARLVGVIEERGGRLDNLKENLDERPGHEASIDAVSDLLASKGQHRALADLLEQQAQRLETATDTARAAKLWARYAAVAETETKEIDRAIAGHRRVVALAPTSDSLRALARLNLERSQPSQAVPWLESLLGTVPVGERLLVVSQLAKAHLSANQPDRAITAIEVNLDDKEPALELRTLLADLYRKADQLEPLARHLTRSLPLLKDDKLTREFAREAASLYLTRLAAPAKAIPALESALALDPTDKELRAALAMGQRVAGRLPEARAALAELITDFGRRRSPDRAALHVELARVSQAEGKLDEAMAEMEAASKMDVSNAAIQKELAEMARGAGQLDKAERTYRALLLVVRRQPPGDDEAAVGASEVLFELHKLALTHGGADQSKELLESAMETAIQSDAEVRRLRRSLIAHSEGELLLRVLEKRLATNPEPHSQARLLSDMAEALDGLGRGGEALDAMIRAIGVMPSQLDLHERARTLARTSGQTKRFVEAVESVVDRLRRKDDPPLIANLLMRAGEALEEDAQDMSGAATLYRRVEILGERLAEAFYAQARVAAALGDTAEQARTLDKMFELAGTDGEPTAAQIDALYRLAEIFLSSDSRRKQGFDLLERAFAAEPRWGQAGRLLRAAAQSGKGDDSSEKVMAMYERVARNGGDGELLLDFLERRAAGPGATTQQIREAVDVATDQGQEQRAEALLVRAVAQARDSAEGLKTAPWAVIALAERRLAAGDLTQARDLAYEVAPIADGLELAEPIDGLAMRIATRALAHRRMDLAAELYEFLRERQPADRAVWQPLLAIYRELGDADRLSTVIATTLPNLVTPSERNTLRLEHARFLIDPMKRYHDALDVLRDALADDADNLEAAELFESTLRQLGDDDGIAEFLWSRFEDAQRRGHRDSTVDVALRLGDLLKKSGSSDAVRVYRAALIVAPDDREILRRVVAQLGEHDNPREGAVLMERLLAVETPDHAPLLAGRLATMWEAAGDLRGVQRTLELAHGSAPDDTAIHDRLETWYRDHELWGELAELMTRDAERLADSAAVDRLREAAAVYSGHLGQPLKAAEVLRKARQRAPQVAELVTDHAAALAAAGELDAAQRAIGEALATVHGPGRLALLLLRASFRQQLGDDASAVSDLTEAYDLDKGAIAETLVAGLERLRVRAERDGDLPTERTATLRLSQLLTAHGDLERGRTFLVGWIERDPRDAEPLYLLCDLDESISHWDGVAAAATRLAYITEGEAQVTAALRAASAASQAGRPGDAVPVLELVHQHQPEIEVLRNRLREVYEAAGEFRLLASILLADADHGADRGARYSNYRRAAELLLYQLADSAAAQVPASRALELQPDDHAALLLNVDVLIASNLLEDAGRSLDAAISAQKKRTPELAVLQQRMAHVSQRLGDKEAQLGWLKKAFDVDRKNAEVAAELAGLATEIGDYELALKPLRAITLMENPSPVTRPMALLWEAKIEHARGNRAKAELWAKKALRDDPAFADAQQFLDELGRS